jgi:para-aminobenzoate synthetase component 1
LFPGLNIRLDSSDPAGAGRDWACRPGAASMRVECAGLGQPATLRTAQRVVREWADPLEAMSWMASGTAARSGNGRWIGHIGYDLGRLFETVPARADDDLRFPLFEFTFHDRAAGTAPPPPASSPGIGSNVPPRWNFSRGGYEDAVRRVIEYIRAGDVFQVNLSRRCTLGLCDSAAKVYERLLGATPATYGALLDYGSHALLCNSPELFLRVTPLPDGRRRVITRPIKGTRPRGPGMAEQLRASQKDQAELNMIVDLERNDLGRVCEIGSVRVSEPRGIEAHPTVYHGVATVEGTLPPGVGFVALLRATFPGGSVTGAPKIRAMEIIEELEPTRRGPYCGAIGYLDTDGTIEFNVAIRTMIVTADGLVHVPVGGGIVADSDPRAEFDETEVKARAMFRALGIEPQPDPPFWGPD